MPSVLGFPTSALATGSEKREGGITLPALPAALRSREPQNGDTKGIVTQRRASPSVSSYRSPGS